jgi:hypothetical protein
MGEKRYTYAYNVLGRKSKGKRELCRLRHRWEDNIKLILSK